ncbi:MAG TPA: SusD/RagB family nutrient-binding outer membrane lipoprotein, partial [Gemmatimonadaceae bacterium]|nr:SusD/RagB family nutrient-binding outer membrane lipoprotein [Gemmatimonadaceae bacterium]
AEVHEAMIMMLTADTWGDVPYREAITNTTQAAFDPQMQIYDDLLTLLDKAIVDLNGGGNGPGSVDLVYGGDKTKWIQAAHTLKARIYLHRVEKLGNAEYGKALTEARLGISAPANDWLTQHSAANAERNVWNQFQTTSGFGQDLVAGAKLVAIMKAQNDPRLPDYYAQSPNGGYIGFDVTVGTTDVKTVSLLRGNRQTDPQFRQPIITYDENQLIIAEASLQTGDAAGAALALRNVRDRYGKSVIAAPTLNDIITEKYIALFQNPEVWNDYKRTCLPALTPAVGKAVIPGRFLYGQTLVQTDPQPATENDNITTRRNTNDLNACQ